MTRDLLNFLMHARRWLVPTPGALIALGGFMFVSTLLMTDYVPPGAPDSWRHARLTLALWGGVVAWGVIRLFRATALDRRHRDHVRRAALGLCPRCGYDLRATPGVCPESGDDAPTCPPSGWYE